MKSTQLWRDLIQDPNRLTRTNVVFDGVDLSQMLSNYEMSDELDQDGKASIFGMISVKTITISLFGNHPKYDTVHISHYVTNDIDSETFDYGTYNLESPIYDEKSDVTTYTIDSNIYDDMVTSTITGANTPKEYLDLQDTIKFDDSEWNLGNSIIVEDSGTAFYETYKDMALDMALCTASFGIMRGDTLVYRTFTPYDYWLNYIFELKLGENMLPVSQLNLTTDLGDNVTIESENNPDNGTHVAFNNLELIRNNREDNIDMLFGQVEDLSYHQTIIEYVGDPAIEVGDIISYHDQSGIPSHIYVTGLTFKDNGAFGGTLKCEILTSDESNTNFVGDYTKRMNKTVIEVDKINQTIIFMLNDITENTDSTTRLRIDIDEITQIVSNIDTTNNIIPNFNGYNGWKGWTFEGGSLKAVSGLTFMENLKFNTNWIRRKVDTEAIYAIEFFTSGKTTTPKSFVTGGEDYSYNVKITNGKANYIVNVNEYNTLDGARTKTTPFTIDVSIVNPNFTITLASATKYVDLTYTIPSAITPTNVQLIEEQVFNKGQPGEFKFSVAEFVNKTEAQIAVLSDSVTTTVTKVDTLGSEVSQSQSQITQNANAISSVVTSVSTVDGKVNTNSSRITQNATAIGLKADKITLDGYVKFTALSSAGATTINGSNITTGTIQANRINFNGATGTNVNLTGQITATSGKIGGFTISGNNLSSTSVSITPTSFIFDNTAVMKRNTEFANGSNTRGTTNLAGGVYIGSTSSNFSGVVMGNLGYLSLGSDLVVGKSGSEVIVATDNLMPMSSSRNADIGSFGNAGMRFNQIYLKNQPNVASDMRYKHDIQDIDPLLIEIIGREVKPKQYRTEFDDKIHFGYIAQDVERALYKYCGNDKDKYAMLAKSESYMSLLYGELNVIIEAYNRLEIEKLKEKAWKN